MKKEQFITTFVMCVVSVLVLIGFTVAWYSSGANNVTATGMQMSAAQAGDITIALQTGGKDISELLGDNKYVDIGLAELTNIEEGKMAPGAFGRVTFYITPKNTNVRTCNVVPLVQLQQEENGEWYPDPAASTEEEGDGSDGGNTGDTTDSTVPTIEELAEIAGKHIAFFSDEAMTQIVDEANPYQVTWESTDAGTEKTAVLYWKWYYENPSSTEKEDIDAYDKEDTLLGNYISNMKFYFSFSTQ